MSRAKVTAVVLMAALALLIGPLTSSALWATAVSSSLMPLVACVAAVRSSRHPGAPRTLLRLVAVSMACNTLGFIAFHLQWAITGHPSVSSVADPLYFAAYVTLVLGWVLHLRRHGGRHRAATLDAALVVIGPVTVVAALVVHPMLVEGRLGELVVLSVYPLLDLALLTALIRAVLTRVVWGYRAVLWLGATSFMIVADAIFFVLVVGGPASLADWYQTPYAVAFTLVALAVTGPDQQPGLAAPTAGQGAGARLVLISSSSCVPATVLVVQGLLGYTVDWLFLGVGAVLAAVLAAVRLNAALHTSQVQAAALERLARYDDLTGLPNRRELTVALEAAVLDPSSRVVAAVLDLDHFKRVNDAHGHAAGDLLLQLTTRAWQAALPVGGALYRWGGEEFVVLLRGDASDRAVAVLERLRTATPRPHTVSVGLAVRRPGEAAADLLVRADVHMYRAKTTGRDRLCGDGVTPTVTPTDTPQRRADDLPDALPDAFPDALTSRATSAG